MKDTCRPWPLRVLGESGLRRQGCFNLHDRHWGSPPSKNIFACPSLWFVPLRRHIASPAGQVQVLVTGLKTNSLAGITSLVAFFRVVVDGRVLWVDLYAAYLGSP